MLFSFNTRKNTKKFADDTNDKKKANEKLRRFMLVMLAWAKFDTSIIDETKGRRSKPEEAGETDLVRNSALKAMCCVGDVCNMFAQFWSNFKTPPDQDWVRHKARAKFQGV